MAIIRTKRKTTVDPNGYSKERFTSEKGKGYQSTSESYESVKEFCESAFIDGYMLAQREYVEKEKPSETMPGPDIDPEPEKPKSPSKMKGKNVDNGKTTPPTESAKEQPKSSSPESNGGSVKKWWNKLSEGEKKFLKGAGIATGTALAAAGIYSLIKKYGKESEDPYVQKAYTYNFIDGYFWAQKEFGEDGFRAEAKVRKGEASDKDKEKRKLIGLGIGSSAAAAAGVGGALASKYNLEKRRDELHKEADKIIGGRYIIDPAQRYWMELNAGSSSPIKKYKSIEINGTKLDPDAWNRAFNDKKIKEAGKKLNKAKRIEHVATPAGLLIGAGGAIGTIGALEGLKKYKKSQRYKED
jgi:hypothetical protein